MKIFLDTADVSAIKKAAEIGIIDGVTTNPSLIAKSGRKFETVVREIAQIVSGPISAEVTSQDTKNMIKQALPLAKIHKNIVIKVPMTEAGIAACVALRKKNIRVNVTLVFHLNQALLAARAGANFVSPFMGRLDDIGEDGAQLVSDIVNMYCDYGFETEVLAASIRNPLHVQQVAQAGADIATMPPEVFHKLFLHHLTDAGLERFFADWKTAKK